MQRRYSTVLGYTTQVVLPPRSLGEPRLRRAVGVSGQRAERMIPPTTLPHNGERWAPVQSSMPSGEKGPFNPQLVEELDMQNFDQFIRGLEKALVMFYNPNSAESNFSTKEFGHASERERHFSYGFGCVDGTVQTNLCQRENATNLPMFRLYSNGYNLSTIVNGKNFNANQMHMLMKMTPVLTQPRVDFGMGKIRKIT